MGLLRTLGTPSLSLLMIPAAIAQTPARGGPTAPGWPQKTIRFPSEKPVLGLPLDLSRSAPRCSSDDTTYFEVSGSEDSATGTPSLYRVSDSGETRLLPRKLPSDYSSVTVRDFFPAEHTLVTLLEAVKRNEADSTAPPREVRYFLSLSDHDGDGAELLLLDVRFKPLKVALFGTGDFLVLGWDEINLLPVLALVKDTGTVRRFFELESGKGSVSGQAAATSARPEELAKASFVPYGDQVLLTFPGTAKSFQVWSAVGESRMVPWRLPGGYVLHDVLVSGVSSTMVVRVRAATDSKEKVTATAEHLFEISSNNGGLLREFLVEKPSVQEVTCAAKGWRLTAIVLDDMPGQAGAATNAAGSTAPARLVISTAPR